MDHGVVMDHARGGPLLNHQEQAGMRYSVEVVHEDRYSPVIHARVVDFSPREREHDRGLRDHEHRRDHIQLEFVGEQK